MPPKHNGKARRITKAENSGIPAGNPMSGVFDFAGMMGMNGQPAAASSPLEFSNGLSYSLISLYQIMLTYAYVMYGPLRTLVDQPVLDAFRGGVTIKSDEVSPEEMEDLNKELKRMKYWRKASTTLRWARLYGGAGMIVNVNEDFTKEFKVESINEKTKLDFKVADRWELAWSGIPDADGSTFSYHGAKIHPSRVHRVMGDEAPSLAAPRLQGWGMSVIECVLRELNSYIKENNVIFEFLDEAKVDIWKIQGFNAQILNKAAAGATAKRIQIASQMKNFLNAITLDKEDDYEQKTLTFSGLSDILEQIRIGIAAAVRMPMAKIFGLSAKGFATGEDDLENYNAIVEVVREQAVEIFDGTIPAVCMKVWGFVPDDLKFEFKTLRVLSAEQEQNVLNAKFQRLSSLYSQGIMNPVEYCAALKQENILVMETEVSKGIKDPEPVNFGGFGDEEGGDQEGEKGSAKAKKEQEPQDKEAEG